MNARAFSLVEVVLALGLIAFCLVALLGMIPVGLGAMENARNRAGATQCLDQISDAIQAATHDASGQYRPMGAYSNAVQWKLNRKAVAATLTNLSLWGTPTLSVPDQRLAARIELSAPADAHSPGSALVSIAWPSSARWDASSMSWSHVRGSVSAWVLFNPAP